MAMDRGTAAVFTGGKGITGSTLKLLAIITMLLDHTGVIILRGQLRVISEGAAALTDAAQRAAVQMQYAELHSAYLLLRYVGRPAFPIFCFLLVEGFLYTGNLKKYIGRLFLFALVSEVPFDIGFSGQLVDAGHQNVFFTLLIGLLVITGFRWIKERENGNAVLWFLCRSAVLTSGLAAAYVLQTDYSFAGVLVVAVMYRLRENRPLAMAGTCVILMLTYAMEWTAVFAMIPVAFYNGKRGWNMKWFFYLFYPLHILVLYFVARHMGLAS